jgi:hypothetical protein
LSPATVPPLKPAIIAKSDTGATAHYFKNEDAIILHDLLPTNQGPQVRLPNNSIIQATHAGRLPYDHLPPSATSTHIFPGLKSASLLSIGQLCDVGCKAVFRKRDLQIYDEDHKLVINGKRNPADGLWDIDIPSTKSAPSDHSNTKGQPQYRRANAVLQLHKTKAKLAQYLHAACFSPLPSTFVQAIKKGHFITWPGLTAELITKHLPPSIATEKGHIKQEFKNIRSTQTPATHQDNAETERDDNTNIDVPGQRTNECYVTIATKEQGTTYSDLAGRYPIKSARGNQYIMIC